MGLQRVGDCSDLSDPTDKNACRPARFLAVGLHYKVGRRHHFFHCLGNCLRVLGLGSVVTKAEFLLSQINCVPKVYNVSIGGRGLLSSL